MESLKDLRKRRLSLGIPLGEMARAVGRSDATLSRIERGQIQPSYDLVQRMVRFLEEREGVAAPHLTAGDLLRPSPVTVDGSATLLAAANLMEERAFSQLPVVEGSVVTGSLSESSLLRALADPAARRTRSRYRRRPFRSVRPKRKLPAATQSASKRPR